MVRLSEMSKGGNDHDVTGSYDAANLFQVDTPAKKPLVARVRDIEQVGRKSPIMHTLAVVTSIVEKVLVNLDVLSQVEVGEKLDWTSSGHFVIQKPTYWTKALRIINRTDRWNTLSHIQDVVSTAETMEGTHDGTRLQLALQKAIHGMRNLQHTYQDDILMSSSLNVLLQRLGERYTLDDSELM